MKINFPQKNKHQLGFIVLLLDFLFIAIGIFILLISLLGDKEILKSIMSFFLK